ASAEAAASPMPRPPPVTSARRPSRREEGVLARSISGMRHELGAAPLPPRSGGEGSGVGGSLISYSLKTPHPNPPHHAARGGRERAAASTGGTPRIIGSRRTAAARRQSPAAGRWSPCR